MVDEGVLVTGRVAESRRHNQFYTVDIMSEIHDDLLTLIGLRLERAAHIVDFLSESLSPSAVLGHFRLAWSHVRQVELALGYGDQLAHVRTKLLLESW